MKSFADSCAGVICFPALCCSLNPALIGNGTPRWYIPMLWDAEQGKLYFRADALRSGHPLLHLRRER